MIKGIVFDVDNTLIDFVRFKQESCDAAIDAMIKAGLKIEKAKARQQLRRVFKRIGIENHNIFDEFLKDVEGKIDYRKLARAVIAYRARRQSLLHPYPGVVATLAKLKRKGLKMGVCTDAPRIKAWIRLCNMHVEDYFDFVVTFDDTGMRKPHPAPFVQALRQMKLKRSEILMVGDNSKRDVVGAKRMGFRSAFAAYGSKDKNSKADYTLRRFEDLLRIM